MVHQRLLERKKQPYILSILDYYITTLSRSGQGKCISYMLCFEFELGTSELVFVWMMVIVLPPLPCPLPPPPSTSLCFPFCSP